MGHRANYIIIDRSQYTMYYANWGAVSLCHDIFFGPEVTANFMAMHPVEEYLLDEVECEGAALLDLDQRSLVFFGWNCPTDPTVRKHYLGLLQEMYPTWNIAYAMDGIREICRYVGRDLREVVYEGPEDEQDDADLELESNALPPSEPVSDREALAQLETLLLQSEGEVERIQRWVQRVTEKLGGTLFSHAEYFGYIGLDRDEQAQRVHQAIKKYRRKYDV